MYVDTSTITTKDKKYTRHLLRESFRENGKVKHRTIANLSSCSPEEIQAIKLALKHKGDLLALGDLKSDLEIQQGPSFGAVWVLFQLAKELGIAKALGNTRASKLGLWQVIARTIGQGSRLSAVRLASRHACCDILNLQGFDEDDLYENLDWLCDQQAQIEDRLFENAYTEGKPTLFLYDVTSSYLEGTQNELGAFGYNRDKKTGKQQIVIGLICDDEGQPLSIEVFPGNTNDVKTFRSQLEKVSRRFGGERVVFVGDRGMIRGPQIDETHEFGYQYISGISKPEIEKLMRDGVLQMSLFDSELHEVVLKDEKVRYVIRRNPFRAQEMKVSRSERMAVLERYAERYNRELIEHPRAEVKVRQRYLEEKARKLKISQWLEITAENRSISLKIDQQRLNEHAKLDGCYVLKTDVMQEDASKETVHQRYKDLALVEKAFRTMKTTFLEMRPIHVRRESRTKGHAFVVMLAYRLVQELKRRWASLDITAEEGIDLLATWTLDEVTVRNSHSFSRIPKPCSRVQKLLELANIPCPKMIPRKGEKVATKKKLTKRRITS